MVADNLARTVNRLLDDRTAEPDADLLRRFIAARDEAAFAALVRRHGPMVFGVCRRTLGHVQDAEDAFQATFVVLARKAHTVRPDGLSRWLYGVAVRVSNKARVRRSRRVPVPAELNEIPDSPGAPPADWLPLFDAALARLPERDRGPILLCDLLGRSRAEAAAELGLGEGTLSSRLARARHKLRARLTRLGIVPGVLTVAALAPEPMPAALIESTGAAASPAARTLAEGVLRSMALKKLAQFAAAAVCVAGTLTAGIVWLPAAGADPMMEGQEVPKGAPPAKDPSKPDPDWERIQGGWIVESVASAPTKGPAETPGPEQVFRIFAGAWMRFDGDRVDFRTFPGADRRFKLDPARDPKWIDFHFRNVSRFELAGRGRPGSADRTRPGIYQFDGDKLRLALGDDLSLERPRSFDRPAEGSPLVSLVLRRPTAAERAASEQFERDVLRGTWVAALETSRGQHRAAPPGVKLEFMDGRLRFDAPNGSLQATYALNLATRPWQIDLTASEDWGDVKKGRTVAGLMARQGWRIILALGAPTRPASFEEAGRDGTVYTFVREGMPDFDLPPPDPATKEGGASKADQSRLRQLQRERVTALDRQLQGQFERVKIGKDPLTTLLDATRELAELEVELAETKEAKLAALEAWVRDLRYIETQITELHRAGLQTTEGASQARAARLKAEIELEKLKAAK